MQQRRPVNKVNAEAHTSQEAMWHTLLHVLEGLTVCLGLIMRVFANPIVLNLAAQNFLSGR